MKKTFKKLLCLVICFLLCLTTPVCALSSDEATNQLISPRYSYVAEFNLGLDISTSGKAHCFSSITLNNSLHSCTVKMVLQRNDGSGWEDVKNWSSSGGQNVIVEKDWYVLSGYDYRVESTLKVYNANDRLIETLTEVSPVSSY